MVNSQYLRGWPSNRKIYCLVYGKNGKTKWMTRDFLAFEVSRLLSIYAHEQFCVTIKKEFYMVSIYVCHVLVLLRKLYRIKKLPFAVNMLLNVSF